MDYWKIALVANAVIGLCVFEWAWAKFARFRRPNKDLNELFPAMSRSDSPKWQKWKFYPGAVTLMLPKILFCILVFVILLLCLNIVMIGHAVDQPVTGVRKTLLKIIYKSASLSMGIGGLNTWFNSPRYITLDEVNRYEKYLGPTTKVQQTDSKTRPSAIVSNHMGFMDIYAMILSPFFPNFTAKAAMSETPVLNKITAGISLYIKRGGTPEERDQIVEQIIERQELIEKPDSEWQLLAIFAEATVSNG